MPLNLRARMHCEEQDVIFRQTHEPGGMGLRRDPV